MAGAGCPRGAIISATDAKGYAAAENVYRRGFRRVALHKMGIDPNQVLHTNTGRPVQFGEQRTRIRSCSRSGPWRKGRFRWGCHTNRRMPREELERMFPSSLSGRARAWTLAMVLPPAGIAHTAAPVLDHIFPGGSG